MTQIPTNLSSFIKNGLKPPRVLLIDPSEHDAAQITQAIAAHYNQNTVTVVSTLRDALAEDMDQFDLAISAMDAGDSSGSQVIEELLLLRPDMPIIMLAVDHVHVDAAQVMREGAYDYVIKSDGYLHSLPAIIEKNLAIYQIKQENARLQVQLTATLGQLRHKNEQLQHLVKDLKAIAATDSLTGIANRRSITQTLDQYFAHALRQQADLAIIAIDLDGFKKLNDTVGHAAGDRVLIQVAKVLAASARASDVPGRIGGDEFIAVLPETDSQDAIMVAERIQADFAVTFAALAKQLGYPDKITISVGVATRTQTKTATATDLLAAADRALYRAKDAGRSCIMVEAQHA